ncbi:hypothetical protein BT63DRAFT_421289, partial [Microthyrium microscopicum]
MSGPSKLGGFSNISNKLSAPSKKSLFERQKAEQEAKKKREEAENAAAYQDFVKSFENEDDDDGPPPRFSDQRGGAGASRRHFAPSAGLKSGPGSLGPPPSSLSRKRARPPAQKERGLLAFDSERVDAKAAFQQAEEDDEDEQTPEERTAPKPTLHLSLLPPGTSVSAIKALIPTTLVVDGVRILPSGGNSSTERKSGSAIVTLAKDTPASDIDAAVSSLQNRYLGLGFNLNISRHLSSAVINSIASSSLSTTTTSHPFGAKPVEVGPGHPLSRAPPPHRGGYAPPSSYVSQSQSRGGPNSGAALSVNVKAPSDIKQLKLIHKTLEAVLTHGPGFEALLMSRPEVQRDEKYAWLWDARSTGGVWYRWRLFEVLSGRNPRASTSQGTTTVFSGGAPWQAPENTLRFEFTPTFESFVDDADYDSSAEEDSGDEADKQRAPDILNETATPEYLNPLQKAKLTHLLSRLPSTTARLRRGDVARVTAFAISHAGRGSDEVVSMMLDNVERPFVFTSANPDYTSTTAPPNINTMTSPPADTDEPKQSSEEDRSSATLIALFLISDLLSASATSGVRHAWRYRGLFENALRTRRTFARLGRLERELHWGRLRAEKWRRAVGQVLTQWETWCVFSSEAHEELVKQFEELKVEEEKREAVAKEMGRKKSGGWKAVEKKAEDLAVGGEDVDGTPMMEDDVDGEPMEEDDDLDGVPMDDSSEEDVEPMAVEDEEQGEPMAVDEEAKEEEKSQLKPTRARAVDMFAQSDED